MLNRDDLRVLREMCSSADESLHPHREIPAPFEHIIYPYPIDITGCEG